MSNRKNFPKLWPHAAALMSGVELAFCFPTWNVGNLVWVALTPLLAALWFSEPQKSKKGKTIPRWRHGFLLGYIAGLGFFLTNLWWLWSMAKVAESFWAGLASWIALPAYLALYFGAFGAFAATVGRWVLKEPSTEKFTALAPSLDVLRIAALNGAAWCGLELMRGWFMTGFGWNGLGVALHEYLMLIQIADIIGVTGLSAIIMFVNCIALATVVRLVREFQERKRMRPHLDFAAGMAVIIGVFLYGLQAVTSRPEKTIDIRTAIIQLNTPIDEKFAGDSASASKIAWGYTEMTHMFVENSEIDLVLWPETALPGRFTFPGIQKFLNETVLPAANFTLITGMEEETLGGKKIFNSISLLNGSTETFQSHKKIHLVPFGEYIPFRESPFPVFEWMFGGIIAKDFTPGDSYEPLTLTTLKDEKIGIVPLVCFEDTIPDHARRFVREGPQLLITVTNNGWFFETANSHQHVANAKFRCVELKRPMVRAGNTGVSCIIDENGNLYDRYAESEFLRVVRDEVTDSTFIRGSITTKLKIPANPPITFFAKHGNLFSKILGGVALIFVIVAVVRAQVAKKASR